VSGGNSAFSVNIDAFFGNSVFSVNFDAFFGNATSSVNFDASIGPRRPLVEQVDMLT